MLRRTLFLLLAALALPLGPVIARDPAARPGVRPRVIDGYRELRAVNENPKVLRPMPTATWPKPNYPFAARKERQECALVLRVFYGPDGRAERVDPIAVIGSRALAGHAAAFARANWAITPVASAETGKPLRVFFETPVTFTLEEGYGTLAARLQRARKPGEKQKDMVLRLAKAEAGGRQ